MSELVDFDKSEMAEVIAAKLNCKPEEVINRVNDLLQKIADAEKLLAALPPVSPAVRSPTVQGERRAVGQGVSRGKGQNRDSTSGRFVSVFEDKRGQRRTRG